MRTLSAMLVVLLGAAASPPIGAQELGLDLVFSAPGARSTGLGGAFVAIADDATAAYANPAGLVQLVRPELSAELRLTVSEVSRDGDETTTDITGLGFVAGVLPLGRWTLAAYGHRVARGELASGPDDSVLTRSFEIRRWAAAAAYRLSETLSVGAGVSYFDGEAAGASREGSRRADDIGLNAGVLWSPTWWLNLGGFLREGPALELGRAEDGIEDLRLALPDLAGLGIALRPGRGHWTVGLEWDRVSTSSLVVLTEGVPRTVEAGAGDRLHLGVEYVALEWSPVTAFRGGLWRQTERKVTGLEPAATDIAASRDDLHVSLGFGLVWRRLQLDFGLDVSDPEITLSTSVIVNF